MTVGEGFEFHLTFVYGCCDSQDVFEEQGGLAQEGENGSQGSAIKWLFELIRGSLIGILEAYECMGNLFRITPHCTSSSHLHSNGAFRFCAAYDDDMQCLIISWAINIHCVEVTLSFTFS